MGHRSWGAEEGELWANPRQAFNPQAGVRWGIREQERGSCILGEAPGKRQQDAERQRLPGVSGTARQDHRGHPECDTALSVPLKAPEVAERANESETCRKENGCLLGNLNELTTKDQMSNGLLNRCLWPRWHRGLNSCPHAHTRVFTSPSAPCCTTYHRIKDLNWLEQSFPAILTEWGNKIKLEGLIGR